MYQLTFSPKRYKLVHFHLRIMHCGIAYVRDRQLCEPAFHLASKQVPSLTSRQCFCTIAEFYTFHHKNSLSGWAGSTWYAGFSPVAY